MYDPHFAPRPGERLMTLPGRSSLQHVASTLTELWWDPPHTC